MNTLWLLLAIVAEVIGTSALKASDGFSRPRPSVIGAVSFAIALYLLSLALRTVPMGVAYAVWSGVGIVLISIVGRVVYGQTLDAAAWAGIAMIIGGVLVINLKSGAV